MDCPQFKSSKTQNFFQENRLIFADNPEKKEGQEEGEQEKTHAEEAGDVAEKVRERTSSVPPIPPSAPTDPEKTKLYPMGEKFDLGNEVNVTRNISKEAAEYLDRLPAEATEALRDLYEYDGYSYTHTVQMLNEGCVLLNNEEYLDAIKKAGMPEGLTDEELKLIFMGAIAFHDWGKREINRKVLVKEDKLDDDEFDLMKTHVMHTAQILTKNPPKTKSPELAKHMTYAAVSHHRHRAYIMQDKDYPKEDEIELLMPGYIEWFGQSGEGISNILAMMDINDAIRSNRPYMDAEDKEVAIKMLKINFLQGEDKDKYKDAVDAVAENWEMMTEGNTHHRKVKGI